MRMKPSSFERIVRVTAVTAEVTLRASLELRAFLA